MRKKIWKFAGIVVIGALLVANYLGIRGHVAQTSAATPDTAQWAESTAEEGPNASYFNAVAVDTSGNSYAVGYLTGNGTFDFGDSQNHQTVNGGYEAEYNDNNAVIVKYDSSGNALWAKSTATLAPAQSEFLGVAVDNTTGNVYAVGEIVGNGTFDFGDSQNHQTVNGGDGGSYNNAVIVKYDANGNTQWAESTAAGGPNDSEFTGVAVDNTSHNVYAVGEIDGSDPFDFGGDPDVTAQGGNPDYTNAVIVQYDSGGTAQWAESTAAGGPNDSEFTGVAVDNTSHNVYAVGEIDGSDPFDFGGDPDVTAQGGNPDNLNAVIVQYDSGGTAQWAESTELEAQSDSYFNGVAVDSSGIYAVGYIDGYVDGNTSGEFNFGSGALSGADPNSYNAVIVKYSSGAAQWAETPTGGGPSESWFMGVAVGSSGIYAVGYISGSDPFNFGGDDVTAQGGDPSNSNAVIVQYDASGTAQWAESTAAGGPNDSEFTGVAVDSSDNVYAAGYIDDTDPFNFGGDDVTAQGGYANSGYGHNTVIVQYASETPTPTETPTPSPTETPTPTPSASATSFSPASAPTCGQSAPTGVPNLYKITTTGTTASLYFTSVDNATNYQVFYGYSSGDSRFGGTFSGSSPVTINYLKPFTLYYFAVKGENVCAGGPLSGWLYAVTNGSGSYAGGTNTTNTTAQNNSTYQSPSASPTPTPSPLASPPPSQPSVQNNSSSVSFFSGILHFILHLFGR